MNNSFEGIVLKKVDYRDYDAMLSVLTASGKRSVLARGINKISSKNAHCCQLFTLSRFNLLEKGSTLKNAELIKSYRGLREDLLKQGIAQLMMEVMDRLEEMMFGYEELLTCLDLLETAKQPYCILTLFLALIAHEIGIEPNVDSCCRCGSKQQIAAFSINGIPNLIRAPTRNGVKQAASIMGSFFICWNTCPMLLNTFFISIIHLSAKGTNGVMKQFQSQRPFFPVLCYPLPVGCWYTTQPEEVSGGAV